MLSPGEVINGKYRIERLIGEGGMGAVYEARHEVLGTSVALKFLHEEFAETPGLEQRFLQEAKLSATIDNHHITRVSDVDTAAQGAFLVMELLQGEPLQSLLDREHVLGTERAVNFTLQILDGLIAAHALGVVHRDLKPDNVFVTPSPGGPLVKLLDFGIAKLKVEEQYQMTLTRPGAIMGTPEYMAPEQAFSADVVDQRSDIYAVGIMLFEMLSGKRPAEGDSPQEIAGKAIRGEVLRLGQLCPHLPETLVQIVEGAIQPDPDRRWNNAHDMRAALLPFAPWTQSMMPPSAYAASHFPQSTEHPRSRAATSAATPFQPVSKTPQVDPSQMAAASVGYPNFPVQADQRISSVPATIPPMVAAPPPATAEQLQVRTTSMPEVAAPIAAPTINQPPTYPPAAVPLPPAQPGRAPSARPHKGSGGLAWLWLTFGVLALAGGGAWFIYDNYSDDSTTPPEPTRRDLGNLPSPSGPRQIAPLPGEALDDDDLAELPPEEDTPAPPPPRQGKPPNDPVPTIPTFEIPTNITIPTTIPTTLPTSFPTSFPLPFPPPADSPKETAPSPDG